MATSTKVFVNGHRAKFGIIVCGSYDAVDAWIDRLFKTGMCNYFVRFKETRGPALQFGWAEWVAPGRKYVNW